MERVGQKLTIYHLVDIRFGVLDIPKVRYRVMVQEIQVWLELNTTMELIGLKWLI